VADPQRLDPALLTEGQCNEKSQLNELGIRKMPVQLFPQRVVRDIGVPDDRAGVSKRRLLSLGKFVGSLKVKELVILGFGESLPSTLDGSLDPSILAVDRFGNIDATHLLDLMLQDAVAKC
jgi:hypothetical protein